MLYICPDDWYYCNSYGDFTDSEWTMTTLLTIQHDPEGKLLKPLHKVLPLLGDLFREQNLVITPNTHGDYFGKLPWRVWTYNKKGMAEARRDVVYVALVRHSLFAESYYFYCDLDRLIYWARNYPDELRELVTNLPQNDYTIIGRKHMAFQSHPLFQLETEKVMSMIVKEKCGLDMDVFGGARSFSCLAGKWLGEQSTAHNAAQDIEWPLIVKENGGTIGYVEVNGLAYESSFLDIRRDREAELKLRMRNLKSVLEFLDG